MKAVFVIMAAALASCAVPLTPLPDALQRIDAAFQRVGAAADLILPLLPEGQANRVRAILSTIALGIDAARQAETSEDRAAAIARVDAQVAALRGALRR